MELLSRVMREHRWKSLSVSIVLMLFAFKLSYTMPVNNHGFTMDYMRNNDWDVVGFRLLSLFCMICAIIGFKSKFEREGLLNKLDDNH